MIIYIDDNFKCYPHYQENLIEMDVPFFNGKCEEFISGYYYLPAGKEKIYNGKILKGSLAFPWKPYAELDVAQRKYEHEQYLASIEKDEQYTQAYNEGVNEV